MVMFGHVLGYVYAGGYSFFLSFLCGFFGVELFFVLSGVLIGKLLIDVFNSENFQQKLKMFVLRRWLRTLPLYFVMLLVYWFGNHFDGVQNQDVAIWKYFFFIQNFYKVQPTFFGVSWSLSIEEWFYVLFPFILFLIKKNQPKISTKSLFSIGISVFLIYFLLMRTLAFPDCDFTFYEGARKIAFLRLDSIAFGILMAFLIHFYQREILSKKYIFFFLGLLILIANQYLIFKNNYSNLHYFNTLYYFVLGVGLGFTFPFFKEMKMQKNIFGKSIVFISKISYSLYLVHWLVYKFLELKYFSLFNSNLKLVLFFVISFCIAGLMYTFIEKPMMRYRNRITE